MSHPDAALDLTVPLASSGVTSSPRSVGPLDSHPNVRLDHFVVERRLGSGGMGAIYAARDVALDRPVAIKILPAELAREPGAHERFIREAQAQARLRSAHVVQIFFIGRLPPDAGTDGRESLYFAMELIDGESLEAPLARGERLDPEKARQLMIQAARGLHDAHRAGIVHRDVKPGNLLVDREGHLKIADFGLAKPREPALALTQEGAVMGTPYYIAPEQALGEAIDQRADMYGLGCAFYHLLTGAPPFDGSSPMAVISKHLKDTARPVRELAPDISPRLSEIVDRLLRKDPKDRYATYDDLIAALEAAAPTRIEYAGFGVRAAAAAIDGVIAGALIGPLGLWGLGLHIAHVTIGHAYFGQTVAKYVLRIQVQRLDGARLGLGRSLARTLCALWLPFWFGFLKLYGEGVSSLKGDVAQLSEIDAARALIVPILVGNLVLALSYGAGMVLAAVHRQKRAAHDILVGSHVVYRMGSQKLEALPGEPLRMKAF
jgi:uncharacterized RDD family membrane protein YckC